MTGWTGYCISNGRLCSFRYKGQYYDYHQENSAKQCFAGLGSNAGNAGYAADMGRAVSPRAKTTAIPADVSDNLAAIVATAVIVDGLVAETY